jgi:hypothetical protein
MFRRGASILLIVVYLAGQLAAAPHAHARTMSEPSHHDARPHVHVSWFGHGHTHEDGHSHHHHHHDGANESQAAASYSATSSEDHDSDAVYLPNETGQSFLLSKIAGSPDDFATNSWIAIAPAALPPNGPPQLCGASFFGNCSPGTPLYLALRALRL